MLADRLAEQCALPYEDSVTFKSEGKVQGYVTRWMFEAPEFFYYAIADGIRWLFVQHGKWRGLDAREECGDFQMEFDLMTG